MISKSIRSRQKINLQKNGKESIHIISNIILLIHNLVLVTVRKNLTFFSKLLRLKKGQWLNGFWRNIGCVIEIFSWQFLWIIKISFFFNQKTQRKRIWTIYFSPEKSRPIKKVLLFDERFKNTILAKKSFFSSLFTYQSFGST